jgi:hypothetical protein
VSNQPRSFPEEEFDKNSKENRASPLLFFGGQTPNSLPNQNSVEFFSKISYLEKVMPSTTDAALIRCAQTFDRYQSFGIAC